MRPSLRALLLLGASAGAAAAGHAQTPATTSAPAKPVALWRHEVELPLVYPEPSGPRYHLVMGDKVTKDYDEVIGPLPQPRWPSGAAIFVACLGGKWRTLDMEGHEGPEYSAMDNRTGVALSADGKHLACVVGDGRTWWVVHDGKEGPHFQRILPLPRPFDRPGQMTTLQMSPDGRHVLYLGHSLEGQQVVVDGKAGPAEESIVPGSPAMSDDGQHMAYLALRQRKGVLVRDGKDVDVAEGEVGGIALAPDGRRLAYVVTRPDPPNPTPAAEERFPARVFARPSQQSRVVCEGFHGAWQRGSIDRLTFSADGSRLVYVVRDQACRVDGEGFGQPEPEFAGIQTGPVLSPDGKRLAYYAQKLGASSASQPAVLEPRTATTMLRIDGQEKALHLDSQILFSPDGQHVAYMESAPAEGGATTYWVTIDGGRLRADSNSHVSVSREIQWLDPRTLAFTRQYRGAMPMQPGEVYQVQVRVPLP